MPLIGSPADSEDEVAKQNNTEALWGDTKPSNHPVWPKPKLRLGRGESRRKDTSNKCQAFLQISKRHNQEGTKPFQVNNKMIEKQTRKETWRDHMPTAGKAKKTLKEEQKMLMANKTQKTGTKDGCWVQFCSHASRKAIAHSPCRAWKEELVSLVRYTTWSPLRRKNDGNGCFRQMETESQDPMY